MWKILRPPKHKPPVAAEKIDKEYKRLRLQVFIGIFIGYAGYYLVRKNLSLIHISEPTRRVVISYAVFCL